MRDVEAPSPTKLGIIVCANPSLSVALRRHLSRRARLYCLRRPIVSLPRGGCQAFFQKAEESRLFCEKDEIEHIKKQSEDKRNEIDEDLFRLCPAFFYKLDNIFFFSVGQTVFQLFFCGDIP